MLNGLPRDLLGADVRVIGCSIQGLIGRGMMDEHGYIAAAIGLGGSSLNTSTGMVEDFHVESAAKGHALGRTLKEGSKDPLKLVLLHYDPLCGADLDGFLQALHETVGCPVVGGAAAEFWGPWKQTFQYADQRVVSKGAVAVGLSGDCTIETDLCHGTSTIGVEMTVTKAEGNTLLELDGRPALGRLARDLRCGTGAHSGKRRTRHRPSHERSERAARALRRRGGREAMRCQFSGGAADGDTCDLFHQRTVEGVVGGTQEMANSLARRLKGKKNACRHRIRVRCSHQPLPRPGGHTARKRGPAGDALSPDAAWLGTIVWGEIYMFDGQPALANFSYPLVVIAE